MIISCRIGFKHIKINHKGNPWNHCFSQNLPHVFGPGCFDASRAISRMGYSFTHEEHQLMFTEAGRTQKPAEWIPRREMNERPWEENTRKYGRKKLQWNSANGNRNRNSCNEAFEDGKTERLSKLSCLTRLTLTRQAQSTSQGFWSSQKAQSNENQKKHIKQIITFRLGSLKPTGSHGFEPSGLPILGFSGFTVERPDLRCANIVTRTWTRSGLRFWSAKLRRNWHSWDDMPQNWRNFCREFCWWNLFETQDGGFVHFQIWSLFLHRPVFFSSKVEGWESWGLAHPAMMDAKCVALSLTIPNHQAHRDLFKSRNPT